MAGPASNRVGGRRFWRQNWGSDAAFADRLPARPQAPGPAAVSRRAAADLKIARFLPSVYLTLVLSTSNLAVKPRAGNPRGAWFRE